MANQDPQPEIYTTRYVWDADTSASGATQPAGTSQVVSIYTNQANNEEVRIYGIAVRVFDSATGTASTTFNDFAVSIQVGANNVPSNQFDISWLANNINNGGSILMFPSPILVLFQQPLGVTITTNSAITGTGSTANNRTVVVDLIGELAIQKAPPGYRGM
ncbi:MAG: hypothetical protein HOC18_02310 [Candidatus Marinimicrobia bacterium]|nr:hypothetical protein [Candidatus Neomarinimicrobiota bacterium]